MMTAPKKSKRPAPRPSERDRTNSKGDVEFRADLEAVLKDDALSRLGYNRGRDSAFKFAENPEVAFYNPPDSNVGMEGLVPDTIAMGAGYGSSKDVWGHELRHRGMAMLIEMYQEDPKWFDEKFGPEAMGLVRLIGHEGATELGDNQDATWITPDGTTRSLKETIDVLKDNTSAGPDNFVVPLDLSDASEDPYVQAGYAGLQNAAQYILTATGEPPKSQKKEPEPKPLESWVQQRKAVPRAGYAEGGKVEKAMGQGGMVDDGTTVDPKTGNAVPPGSMQEEVEDGIDAKLSEGEYVVPADVVQYFGVGHFEKLRKKAKEELGQMELDGRIGGDSGEDDLPFSDEELFGEGEDQNYAEGGVVTENQLGPGPQTIMYQNAQGQTRPVLFIDGIPVQQIPEGFMRQDQMKEQKKQSGGISQILPPELNAFAMEADRQDPGRSLKQDEERVETERTKPSDWSIEDFETFVEKQPLHNSLMKGVGIAMGPIGPIVGKALGYFNREYAESALTELDARIEGGKLDQQSVERLQNVREAFVAASESTPFGLGAGKSEGLLGGLLPQGGLVGALTRGENPLSGFQNMFKSSRATPTSRSKSPSAGGTSYNSGNRSATSSGGGGARSVSTKSGNYSVSPNAQGGRNVSGGNLSQGGVNISGGGAAPQRSENERAGASGRPFAKGGFVKRRNK